MSARLSVADVFLQFGGITVLESVSFDVEPSTIFGLVGPNGAGKTSLFNCISGHYKPSAGSVSIDGEDVLPRAPSKLAHIGLARTFQHPALQLHSTVLDNVLLGGHCRLTGGALSWALRPPHIVRQERRIRQQAHETLERLDLDWAAGTMAGELPHALHKRVELCRALLSRPKLLLLDEPAAGLSHSEVEDLIAWLRNLRSEFGLTMIVVEHHMGLISAITDRVAVLNQGRKLMEGTAAEAQRDPRVVEAYLGGEAA
ncbi:ABC transporter ATP-binding protein [Arthrobacter castelli]|uniref:ABC transporter ATP-binding protein n=1 Tax=Arthrobacter castelli TaxID=271431 RepID=UPI0003F68267|nr:ABC transporter ATP-binding protein [Arthrobacter castelli]